jgi:hypothetical protein
MQNMGAPGPLPVSPSLVGNGQDRLSVSSALTCRIPVGVQPMEQST